MKKNGKASVLSRQKPRRSKHAKFLSIKFLSEIPRFSLFFLCVGFIFGSVFFLAKRNWRFDWLKVKQSIAWKVDLKLDAEHPLSDRKAEEVIRLSHEYLKSGDRSELANLAVAIQRLDAFGIVHIIRLASDRILITIKPRNPVMCAEIDRLRLVADTGEIYGIAGVEGAPSCPGPRLIGIVQKTDQIALTPSNTIALEAESTKAVNEAINLLAEAESRALRFSTIEFQRYRGFVVYIEGLDTEVALGRTPFPDKLDKLRTLMAKLASRGEVAKRIELDYQGKAFVKLKKL